MEDSDLKGFDFEAINIMKDFFMQALTNVPITIEALTVHAKEANVYTEKKQPVHVGARDPLYNAIGKEMEKIFNQIDQFVTIPNLADLIDDVVWNKPSDQQLLVLQQRLRKKLTLTRRNSTISSYHRGDLQLSGMMWLLAQLRRGGVYDCTTSLMAETFIKEKDDLPDFNEQMKFYLQQFSSKNNFRKEEDKLLADWILKFVQAINRLYYLINNKLVTNLQILRF